MKDIELLAPAGSMETLIAAVNAGANAIYLGGKTFGARRSAQNFTNEELIVAIRYCHERDVSVYVTVNTLIKDEELSASLAFIDFLYHNDVDAVILQDMGLLNLIKRKYPDLPCHASTQMTFHDLNGVLTAQKLGFSRVVLSRELPFEEIEAIVSQTQIEIEFFIHGALCISYSGQCLMSSYIGGRSGNRGACAQPCRKKYTVLNHSNMQETESGFYLSPKDLMTYEHLETLKKLKGVSLKIEGRMKGPDYVYSIVSGYRKGIDNESAIDHAIGINHTTDIDHTINMVHKIEKTHIADQVIQFSHTFNRQFTKGHTFKDAYADLMNYELPSSYGTPVAVVMNTKDEQLEIKLLDVLNKGDEIQFREKGATIGTRADVILLLDKRVESAQTGDVVKVPFRHQLSKGAMLYKTYNAKFIDEMTHKSQIQRQSIPVSFEFHAVIGQRAELKAFFESDEQKSYTSTSTKVVELARNKALDETRVIEQLSKTGGTPFYVDQITCDIEPNMILPVSEINVMRRMCLEAYLMDKAVRYPNRKEHGLDDIQLTTQDPGSQKNSNMTFELVFDDNVALNHVLLSTLKDSVANNCVEIVEKNCMSEDYEVVFYTTDLNWTEAQMDLFISRGVIPVLPRIIRNAEIENMQAWIDAYAAQGGKRVCLTHVGQLAYFDTKHLNMILEGDQSLNVLNTSAMKALYSLGFQKITWSTEIGKSELSKDDFDSSFFIYGRLPLMISEYCPVGGVYTGHDKCGLCSNNHYSLVDERQTVYPLVCYPKSCRCEVMSDKSIQLFDQINFLKKTNITNYRVVISKQDDAAEDLLQNILKAESMIQMLKSVPYDANKHSKGNFNRGIE